MPRLVGGRIVSGFAIGIASGTCTAWLAELYPGADKSRASLVASGANFIGLAAGALTAGLLAQYAAKPLALPYFVYLAVLVASVPSCGGHARRWKDAREASRTSRCVHGSACPPAFARFVAPTATAFGTFAFIGFYAALVPSVLIDALHETNHAVGGALLFELCTVAVMAMIATRRLPSRAAMLYGARIAVAQRDNASGGPNLRIYADAGDRYGARRHRVCTRIPRKSAGRQSDRAATSAG